MDNKHIALVLLIFVTFFFSAGSFAAGVAGRVESVKQLLTVSSAAKKIEESDNQQAKAMLQEAKGLHQQATAAYTSGDEEAAKNYLSQSTQMLFGAARLADGGGAVKEKKQQDYIKRKESFDALLTQHHAIAEEKQVLEKAQMVEAEALVLVAEAETQAGSAEGLGLLNQAYEQIKASIVKMRNGEELVMSLEFATPKDEYDYYLKKTGSQRRAIEVFTSQAKTANRRIMVDRILERASAQESQAAALAAQGDYAAALPLMEDTLNRLRSGLMMVIQ